jgi:hypothetical protein
VCGDSEGLRDRKVARVTELPIGQWWRYMTADEYMAIVEQRRAAHQVEVFDLAWRTEGEKRVIVGPAMFPRIQ